MQQSCIYFLSQKCLRRKDGFILQGKPQALLQELRERGQRVTKTRAALLDILEQRSSPMSAEDLLAQMHKRRLFPNKTTIYRELAFLVAQGLILEVDLGERKKRYESIQAGHHHHLICINCHSITEIDLGEHLTTQEEKIRKQNDFWVQRHALEFFGLCAACH